MFALIFESKVVQIEVAEFPVALALTWTDITNVAPVPKVGWSFDGSVFAAPPPPIRPLKSVSPLTAEELATHLITKGTITTSEVTAIKAAR